MKSSLDGVSVAVLVLLAAFAIDRVVSGVMFLLCRLEILTDPATVESIKEKARAAGNYQIVYSCFAMLLAIVVLALYPEIRILAALGRSGTTGGAGVFDTVLTAIVYVGGADRISGLLQGGAGGLATEGSQSKPIQVTGKLELASTSETEKVRTTGTL